MYGKTLYALAVAVVLALGAAFFVVQSSSQDGKTYKNSVNAFELTYPSDRDIDQRVYGRYSDHRTRGQ